jgi:AcrR family transcriptional regulator
VSAEINIRERILEVAVQIANQDGIKSLTQPKVAKAAGVRQSHLTYYFPRKTDLLAAVLEASHRHSQHGRPKNIDQGLAFLEALMFDPNRMRFFIGAVTASADETELREALEKHANQLIEQIASLFDRGAEDPAVLAFIDRLRGLGIRILLEPPGKDRKKIDIKAIAVECGLL